MFCPCSDSNTASLACPLAPSTSMTTIPEMRPVAIPMFAFGYVVHHRLTVASSLEAFLNPLGTSLPIGCFPTSLHVGSPQAHRPSSGHHNGNTAKPCLMRANAPASLSPSQSGTIFPVVDMCARPSGPQQRLF